MPDYVSVTLLDGFGRETRKLVELTPQLTLGGYVDNANAWLSAYAEIGDLQIVRANLVLEGLDLPETDPAGSNVDIGATFTCFIGDGAGKKASLKIPGIKMSLIGAGGFVDLEDEDVAAFLDLYGDPPDNKVRLSDGEWAESWIQGTLDK